MRIRPLKSSRRRAALENAARAAVEPLEGRLLLSTVTLSVTASGGNWSAFAADSTGDNAGIATFDFDVVGTGGVTVNTGHNKTPVGTDSQSDADGFDDLRQNGTVGTQSGIVVNGVSGTYQGDFGITGAQGGIIYEGANNPEMDAEVIQGYGQVASSPNNSYNVTWANPALLATGTYTVNGPGDLVVQADAQSEGFQTLAIVSNGMWQGPENISSSSTTIPGTVALTPTISNLAFNVEPSNATAGTAISPAITVELLDQNSEVLTGDNALVTLGVDSGPGRLGGVDTVAAVNGVATFSNVSINTAGTYTLSADVGGVSPAVSTSFSVSAAALEKLVFVGQASTGSAGSSLSPNFVVDAEDNFGNVISGFNSNVTLSILPGSTGPVLNGTLTAAASNGQATFSGLSLDQSGTYALVATDTSNTNIAGTSGNLTISAGAPSQLLFTVQPTSITAGSAFASSVILRIEDQFGNTVTSDDSSVSLSVASGPSNTIIGTTTLDAASGVARFGGLTFHTAGTYTLEAEDTSDGLASMASNPFTVSAGATATFSVPQTLANVNAGGTLASSIVVDAEDAFGNPVTNYNSIVTLGFMVAPSGVNIAPITAQAQSGVATFSFTQQLDIAGGYRFQATQGSISGNSAKFYVLAGAASQLVFIGQPGTVTAGGTFSSNVVVDAEDVYGNVATTDNSSVTLSFVGTGGFSPVAVTAQSGIATFSGLPALDVAGRFKLSAGKGTFTATSKNFFVNAGTVTQLAFAAPITEFINAGTVISSIAVNAEDQFGNLNTTFDLKVTLGLQVAPNGTLFTPLLTRAVNGVATFTNVGPFTNIGGYRLKAYRTGLLSGHSSKFYIEAPSSSLDDTGDASAIVRGLDLEDFQIIPSVL